MPITIIDFPKTEGLKKELEVYDEYVKEGVIENIDVDRKNFFTRYKEGIIL